MYYKVLTFILLFPWSILVVMIAGHLCARRTKRENSRGTGATTIFPLSNSASVLVQGDRARRIQGRNGMDP
jgi:hypothetical protein